VARQVRVALVRIAELGSRALARARRNLGPRDRRRFASMRTEKRRREFLAGRALLAQLGVKVDSTPDGGLKVDGGIGASISHARGWVACVVVPEGRPGIDLEPMVARDFAAAGRWKFERPMTREQFYEEWTRYEARFKAFGDGKPRASHREFFYVLRGGVALSLCLPAASRAPRSLRARRPGRSGA
jgi:phosphopantetheinyl transferase